MDVGRVSLGGYPFEQLNLVASFVIRIWNLAKLLTLQLWRFMLPAGIHSRNDEAV
jgi:hypothetical protein